jgi:hypothetical protein
MVTAFCRTKISTNYDVLIALEGGFNEIILRTAPFKLWLYHCIIALLKQIILHRELP